MPPPRHWQAVVRMASRMPIKPEGPATVRRAKQSETSAALFEAERPRLRGLAYRMLGSLADADDVVQEAWLRLRRTEADAKVGSAAAVMDMPAWLTTVTARLALDALRARRRRGEEPFEPDDGTARSRSSVAPRLDPEGEAILAEQVGLALLLVLDRLRPAERLAFVLHDVFDLSFDAIAAILDRTPEAARQVASRARQRVRGEPLNPSMARDREVVAAFARAAREGDLPTLVRLLDPDVTLRIDPARLPPGAPTEVRGADVVAGRARMGAMGRSGLLVLVDSRPALAVAPGGGLELVMTFEVQDGRIVRIEAIADPARLAALPLTLLAESAGSAELPRTPQDK